MIQNSELKAKGMPNQHLHYGSGNGLPHGL